MNFREVVQANVESIRVLAAEFLTDTCLVRRKIGSTVVNGEDRPIYASGEEVRCRLILRSGSQSTNIAAQERLVAHVMFTGVYRMQLPFGTEISEGDHIEYTDISTSDVRTFEVVYVPPHNTMMGAFIIGIQETK